MLRLFSIFVSLSVSLGNDDFSSFASQYIFGEIHLNPFSRFHIIWYRKISTAIIKNFFFVTAHMIFFFQSNLGKMDYLSCFFSKKETNFQRKMLKSFVGLGGFIWCNFYFIRIDIEFVILSNLIKSKHIPYLHTKFY